MVSFAASCLFSALEGEAKFWITLYVSVIKWFASATTNKPAKLWGLEAEISVFKNPNQYLTSKGTGELGRKW